ncbi:MAG: imidazoleglycerol-phosphate dehydratase [Myxococcota bacterium]|jgi:imidazoleglycerol-phosphate dehydratase
MREATATRTSAETDITVTVNLDGGAVDVDTGHGFFDHMLTAMGRHGRLGLYIRTTGDLHIDAHHTVEDTGIVLGQAMLKALGNRKGIERTGHAYMPMDEALVRVAVDLSGRSFVVWKGGPKSVYTPVIDLTVLEGFIKALADHLGANVHVDVLRGRDYHHVVEATFKALGRALRAASRKDGTQTLASTKEIFD